MGKEGAERESFAEERDKQNVNYDFQELDVTKYCYSSLSHVKLSWVKCL